VTLTKNFKRFYSLRGLNESNENWEICNAKGWYGCMPNGTYKIQGVALTTLLARRRMLPPGELRCICAGVTDDDRCRRAKQYWYPYTMCRRASNKGRLQSIMKCKWTERRRSRDGDRQSDRQTDRQTDWPLVVRGLRQLGCLPSRGNVVQLTSAGHPVYWSSTHKQHNISHSKPRLNVRV